MRTALILGCGYVGQRLGRRLSGMDLRVVGTTRSPDRAAEFAAEGIEALVGELSDPSMLEKIARLESDIVFYLIPPRPRGADPLRPVLDAVAMAKPEAFVYVSATSVYGDRHGDWVDETTPVSPSAGPGMARHQAERDVIEMTRAGKLPARVCRVTGIYGPGRTLRTLLESGDYVLVEGADAWVNRIHVDDLVTALLASWRGGADGGLYNLTDDQPHRTSQFANLAADLHGLPRPRWVSESEATDLLGEARLRRKLDSKRVSNRAMKEELGVQLSYPGYETGLPASVVAERKRLGKRVSNTD